MNVLAQISSRDCFLLLMGGAVGLLFTYVPAAFSYAVQLPRRHFIQGVWQCYYYNLQNDVPTLKQDVFRVRKGFLQALSVRVQTGGDGPSYKGRMIYEKGFYLFELKSELAGWEENVFIRFKDPVPQGLSRFVGIGLAKDFHNNASANVVLLSRVKLTEAEVKRAILDGTIVGLEGRIMRLA